MAVIQFACFDPNRQAILLRRKGAGRISCKRTRRVLGLVEVHHHLAVLRKVGIKESPGRICPFAAGEIVKDEEKLIVFQHRIEP